MMCILALYPSRVPSPSLKTFSCLFKSCWTASLHSLLICCQFSFIYCSQSRPTGLDLHLATPKEIKFHDYIVEWLTIEQKHNTNVLARYSSPLQGIRHKTRYGNNRALISILTTSITDLSHHAPFYWQWFSFICTELESGRHLLK